MSTENKILSNSKEEIYHGLPGGGISMQSGKQGNRGSSSFIGYIEEFFNIESSKDPSYAYIRVMNQPSGFIDDENYFGTKSKQSVPSNEFDKIFPFTDVNRNSYYNVSTAGYVDNSTNSPLFKYNDKDTSLISSYNIKNAYGIDTSFKIDSSAYKRNEVNISAIRIDNSNNFYENEVDAVKDEWLKYATYDTVYIGKLNSEQYHTGDILYILDANTDKIQNFITLTSDMENCSFEYFLNQKFFTCDSILSEFYDDDNRATVNTKSFVIADNPVSPVLKEYQSQYLYNFVKHNATDYLLNIISNDSSRVNFLTAGYDNAITDSSNSFLISFDSDDPSLIDSSVKEIKFHAVKGMKLNNLYLSDTISNINIPYYNNSDIIFSDGYHIKSFSDNMLYVSHDESDIAELHISLKASDYFKGSSGLFYGMKIYSCDTRNIKLYDIMIPDSSDADIDFSQVIDSAKHTAMTTDVFPASGNVSLFASMYVKGNKITVYNSRLSTLILSFADSRITSFSVEDGDSDATGIDMISGENGIKYTDTDFIEYSSGKPLCEDCSISLYIKSKIDDSSICDIYINGIPFMSEYKLLSDASIGDSWFSVSTADVSILDSSEISFGNIHFNENLPTQDSSIKTLAQFFDSSYFTNSQIGDFIEGSSDRSIFITVISSYNNSLFKSDYTITQPGFHNYLNDINIDIEPLIKSNQIQDSNESANGILTNQVQYFSDVSISGFTEDTWGLYFTDLQMKISFDIATSEYETSQNYSFTKNGRLHNINLYSQNDIMNFPNNGMKFDFGYIMDASVNYDASISDIDNSEIEFKYHLINNDSSNVITLEPENGWIPSQQMKILHTGAIDAIDGFDVHLDDASISGLTLDECGMNSVFQLRILSEIGNPVPAELNYVWKITQIEITGNLKEPYASGTVAFHKIYEEGNAPESENVKFIVNPITLTLMNSDSENYSTVMNKGNIKWIGPDDNISVTAGLYPLDASMMYDYSPDGAGFNFKNVRISNNAIDISYYAPRKQYFEDNISQIYIFPQNTREIVADNAVTSANSDYVSYMEWCDSSDSSVSSFMEHMNKKYNVYEFTRTADMNASYSTSFISLFYNADAFNAQEIDNEYILYYNNMELDAENYNQFSTKDLTIHNPLLISQDFNIPLRDTSLMLSIDTWNREYELSSNYSDINIFGGKLTKSGNGYMFLDSSDDEGQWSNIYSLAETQEKNSVYAITDSSVVINNASGFSSSPVDGQYYRSLLWTADWIYPNFIQEDSMIKIIPNYLCNSFESYADISIFISYYEYYNQAGDNAIDYTTYMDSFNEKSIFDIPSYIKLKKNKITSLPDAVQLKQLIPYNLLYNIYPRTCYNTDMGENCINVLMLQQPSVRNRYTHEFLDTSLCSVPAHWWNISGSDFDTSSDFIYNIGEPWLFVQ